MTIPAHLRPAYDRAIAKGLSHADAMDCLSLSDNALSPAPSSAAQVLASLAPSADAQPQAASLDPREARLAHIRGYSFDHMGTIKALPPGGDHRGAATQPAHPQAQPQRRQPTDTERRQPTDTERRQARVLQIRSGSLRMDGPDAGSSYALRPKNDAVKDALTAHFQEGVPLADACARFGVALPPDPAR